jgi:hypothetical protein
VHEQSLVGCGGHPSSPGEKPASKEDRPPYLMQRINDPRDIFTTPQNSYFNMPICCCPLGQFFLIVSM